MLVGQDAAQCLKWPIAANQLSGKVIKVLDRCELHLWPSAKSEKQ